MQTIFITSQGRKTVFLFAKIFFFVCYRTRIEKSEPLEFHESFDFGKVSSRSGTIIKLSFTFSFAFFVSMMSKTSLTCALLLDGREIAEEHRTPSIFQRCLPLKIRLAGGLKRV